MRKKIAERILEFLEKQKVIEASEVDLYLYGINQVLLFGLNILTSMLIGLLMDMLMESIVFSFAYIPLRRFSGGYHAANAKVCYLMSTMMIFIVLIIIKHLEFNFWTGILMIIIAFTVICIKAPVESQNKKLSHVEKQFFGKYARVIAAVEVITFIVLNVLECEIAARCVGLSLLVAAIIMLIPEKKQNSI